MFNSQRPHTEDLPTSNQLIKATLGAAVAAGALLVTVVLPSEYAIDPTGIGGALGLTEMGEVKQQLAEEAAADAAMDRSAAAAQATTVAATAATGDGALTPAAPGTATPTPAAPTPAASANTAPAPAAPAAIAGRTDTTTLTLAPGEGAEVKLTAAKGARVVFNWSIAGGLVNYDTHADAPGIDYHGYGKGKQSAGEQGTLVAAFDGKHGWFWRNRGDAPVTVTLKTQGEYSDVRRVG